MAQYTAYNCALSTTTAVGAGTSYASGGKVAIQLDIPSTLNVKIIEWGISFNGSTAAVPANVELVQTNTASTTSTAHTTSTVLPIGDNTLTTRLNFGAATDTGYGNGAITSTTTEKNFDKQYIAPTNQYIKQWPLGREPVAAGGKFVQLRVDTTATVSAIAYIVWEEC